MNFTVQTDSRGATTSIPQEYFIFHKIHSSFIFFSPTKHFLFLIHLWLTSFCTLFNSFSFSIFAIRSLSLSFSLSLSLSLSSFFTIFVHFVYPRFTHCISSHQSILPETSWYAHKFFFNVACNLHFRSTIERIWANKMVDFLSIVQLGERISPFFHSSFPEELLIYFYVPVNLFAMADMLSRKM